MNMKFLSLFLIPLGLMAAEPLSPPEVRLPLMTTEPPIRNVPIDLGEWSGAARMERFNAMGETLADPNASFWVGATEKALYLAVRSEVPPDNRIVAKANALPGQGNLLVSGDDAIEIYIAPNPDAPTQERRVYQGIFNSKGAFYSQLFTGNGGAAWIPRWKMGNHVGKDQWDFVIAIPWSDLGVEHLTMPATMGIRVARTFQNTTKGTIQTEWAPLGGSFTAIATFPKVTWDSQAPIVQLLQLKNPANQVEVIYRLQNPGRTPHRLVVDTKMKPKDSAPTRTRKELTLKPGESIDLPAGLSAALPEERIETALSVSDGATGQPYYQRNFSWHLKRPETVWKLNDEESQNFQYAYYPSLDLIAARIETERKSNSSSEEGKISLSLFRSDSSSPIATTVLPAIHDGVTGLRAWKVPPLEDGEYELRVEGLGQEPLKGKFVRRRFPWEGNRFGLSDAVVPPFTPLEASEQTVRSVFRTHTLTSAGLWQQVEAAGRPLLKSPMRLVVETLEGKEIEATGKYQLQEASGNKVVSDARWEAGALKGSTVSHWDYDGTMRCVITLEKTDEPIRRMTLRIPLDDQIARLFTACTDGLRFNYAGKMPEGKGVIWKSSQAARNSIVGSFVPYLWAGGPLRGLSVFGDSDKGWITSDEVPAQELVRTEDGTLEIRLYLVGKEAKWDAPRSITLGFLATPVKPMPKGWRLWTLSARGQVQAEGAIHQEFLGSNPYWGAVSNYNDIYPRDEDFSYYDQMVKTRETGQADREFIDRWLKGYKLTGSPEQQEQRQRFYEAHVGHAFTVMAKGNRHVLPYTNPRGVRFDTPEGQTFLNEWSRDAFSQREWGYGEGTSYGVDPVASYRDYHAWYWQKMLKTFSDSIYWDNIFMQASYSPANEGSYLQDGGRIQPSCGLWNMRELVRRGMVAVHELGFPNHNMVHMTNTAIAPILAFAGSNLTWEDREGDADFQDRFPREYILTESIGRQFGTAPFALLTSHIRASDEEKVRWAYNTAAGVLLTHEMKPYEKLGGKVDEFWDNYDRLVAFGYGSDEVGVHNYWDDDFPLEVKGNASILLLQGKGKVLLVVCDWGSPGEHRLTFGEGLMKQLPGKLTVRDLKNGTPLTMKDNRLDVPLKLHDFTLIQIESDSAGVPSPQ